MQALAGRVVRFGTFEVDLDTRELRKSGLEVNVQEQPRQVLLALLERPGQIVTREELRNRLWPAGTFVDFEHSLNTAVKKLRDALGDLAENPRFIETVPLRGYRFTAPVEHPSRDRKDEKALPAPSRRPWTAATGGTVVVTAIAGALWWMSQPPPPPTLVGSAQLTYTGRVLGPDPEMFPALITDGTRIYFAEPGSPSRAAQVSVAGGEVLPVLLSFPDGQVLHVSPDASQLLVRNRRTWVEQEGPLWVVPALGGAPHRLGGVLAHDGAWSPDGQRIVYAQGEDLYLAKVDGSESRKLTSTPGRAVWLRWSPDGARLRFTLIDARTTARSLWEVSAEGRDLRPLLPRGAEGADECCGEWTPDGRHFVFRAYRDNRTDIWVICEGRGPFRKNSGRAVRLTTGPLHFAAAVPSRDGRRLFVVGVQPRGEVLRYDLRSREFTPYQAGLWENLFTFSRDGEWVAYIENRGKESTLWRSRVDGSQRLQLTSPPLTVGVHRWSPDGKRIAFMGKAPGKPWKIYVVAAEGGPPQQLLEGDRNEADPDWSLDGQSLIFGHPPDYMAESNVPKAIYVVDLRKRRLSTLPGSEGFFSPRWSPDGRYVAAMPLDQSKIVLFDFTTRRWSELLPPRKGDGHNLAPSGVNFPIWSRDGGLLYFQNFNEDRAPLYRVRMTDRTLERIFDLGDVKRPVHNCYFTSLALDGSPLGSCNTSSSDIYALEWDAR
jgi:Tol biopolymer transport system component/DNA-binding winged helix-turn-helix (wHTH) protein